MSGELEQILVLSGSGGLARIDEIQAATRGATHFEDGSDEDRQLSAILDAVKVRRDEAVREYTKKHDGVSLAEDELRISGEALEEAYEQVAKNQPKLLEALDRAISNVRKYQSEIFSSVSRACSGGTGIRYTPLRRVGVCVPGASAPLPSTVIMTAVPAQVAGVEEIAVVSPPRFKGSIDPVILAVCRALGITEVYRVGGAQAVGALAFGTESIKAVDKIVGPGNPWVQMAKRKVFGVVDIDSVAGPSEVLIIADDSANPAWVAADMLSQVEHGADSSAIVVTDSQALGRLVLEELAKQLDRLGRADEARESLKKYSGIIVVDDMDEAVKLADKFASEHVEVQCGSKSGEIADRICNAGAIFIGPYSPVAVGDYFAGPSHTLPTGGCARFSSAVTSNDFVKSISLIEYDSAKLAESSADIVRLAEVEGLDAHANSIRIRQEE